MSPIHGALVLGLRRQSYRAPLARCHILLAASGSVSVAHC